MHLLPTPVTRDYKDTHSSEYMANKSKLTGIVHLLPTPMAQHSGNTPEEHLRKKPGRAQVTDLKIIVENDLLKTGGLLPTPATTDRFGPNQPNTRGGSDALRTVACFELTDRDLLRSPTLSDTKTPDRSGQRAANGHQTNLADQIEALKNATDWGVYEPAIRKWEGLTRPAPAPTELNKNGVPRLNAEFSEWMMGWPQGWVTDLIGNWRNDHEISRSAALRAIGNGVVPQQAAAALRELLQEDGGLW